MIHNPNEKYCIVLSENKIWIVRNKNHDLDLTKKENISIFTEGVTVPSKIRSIYYHNKINTVEEITYINNLNNIVDKEIIEIFEKYNFYSKIINIK